MTMDGTTAETLGWRACDISSGVIAKLTVSGTEGVITLLNMEVMVSRRLTFPKTTD